MTGFRESGAGMMDYSAHMIARAEHEQMVRSVPRVSEYGDHLLPEHSHRLSRLAAHLLSALKDRFAGLRKPMPSENNRVLNGSLAEEKAL
jgi:hypothetical protein